jgi:flagellar motor switch protein FliG
MAEESVSARRNLQKAAVIVASLGTDLATEVCKRLNEKTIRTLAEEVAHLDAINADEYKAILKGFSESCLETEGLGGLDMARQILYNALGSADDTDITLRQGDGLDQLREMVGMDAPVIARRLEAEMPQTAAVLISQLSATKAAEVLQDIPQERRGDIVARAASLQSLAPGTLQALAEGLDEAFAPQKNKKHSDPNDTFSFMLNLLTNLDRPTQQSLLEDLEKLNPDLATRIQQNLFTFENLLGLPDRALQTVLRSVETRDLAMAVKGLDDQNKAHITENLSERGREALQEEIEALGPVRVADVENARADLAAKARELDESGEITIEYGDDVTYIE